MLQHRSASATIRPAPFCPALEEGRCAYSRKSTVPACASPTSNECPRVCPTARTAGSNSPRYPMSRARLPASVHRATMASFQAAPNAPKNGA